MKRLAVKRPETHIIDTPNRSGDEEIHDETDQFPTEVEAKVTTK